MANYFTHFSCLFDVGAPENLEPALAIYERHAQALDAEDGIDIGFRAEADPHAGPAMLWLSSDEAGDPEHVIAFVLDCAAAFDLSGCWGFVWALTCSKPRLDGFGGGAQLIDLGRRRSLAWLDCEHWLQGALDPTTLENGPALQTSLTADDELIEAEFAADSPHANAAE